MYLQASLFCWTALSGLAAAIDRDGYLVNQNAPFVSQSLPLRILPLGDSLTWGHLSSEGNGYRLDLLNLLMENPVQFVGTQRSGNMTDNYNEGHPGATIAKVQRYADSSFDEPPNVVLLMAGTEDVVGDNDLANAPARLSGLIDEVVRSYPRAAVVVAELPPIEDADFNARAETFNAAISGVVRPKVDEGRRVATVKMADYISVRDIQDGMYPTDHGYSLMARAWYDGIRAAESRNWLAAPMVRKRKVAKREAATTCSTAKTPSTTGIKEVVSGASTAAGAATSNVKNISPAPAGSAQPTTTMTKTTTVTSTVTIKYHTKTKYTTIPKAKPVSTATPCTESTTTPVAPSTTAIPTPSTTPIPTPTPTPIVTSISLPPPVNNVTTPVFETSAPPAPSSIAVPTFQSSAAGGSTPTPTPPPTSAGASVGANLVYLGAGLLFFFSLSGMAV